MTAFMITDKFVISGMQIGRMQSELYMLVTDDNEDDIKGIFGIIDEIVAGKKLEVDE